MGIFSKKKTDSTELNAFLGVGTEYRGKLDFVGTVRIDGRFVGEISTEGDLILGRKAFIKGAVRVGRLTSCGTIEGDVYVKERAVLEKTSSLTGSLDTSVLVVEDGAIIHGSVSMNKSVQAANPKVVTADFSANASRQSTPSDTETVARTGSDNII